MVLERDIEGPVVAHAKKLGFLVLKLARTGIRGTYDRLFISPQGRYIWVEFKSSTGSLSKAQGRFGEDLNKRGIPTYLINNKEEGKCFFDEIIVKETAELERIAKQELRDQILY